MSSDPTPDHVRRALDGDLDAQRRLVESLTPAIQANVARMLRRWRTGSAAGRDLAQEVEDMVQEVFLELYEDDGKTLRRWDPQRLPLAAYVGFVARIRTAETLRSRASPWREEPSPSAELDRRADRETPEDTALSRDELRKVFLCLIAAFKPEDYHLFELLYVSEVPPQQAADDTGKSLDAVYQWRSRQRKRARECRDRLSK